MKRSEAEKVLRNTPFTICDWQEASVQLANALVFGRNGRGMSKLLDEEQVLIFPDGDGKTSQALKAYDIPSERLKVNLPEVEGLRMYSLLKAPKEHYAPKSVAVVFEKDFFESPHLSATVKQRIRNRFNDADTKMRYGIADMFSDEPKTRNF